ncbi:iron(III) transport system ATP-binding protein [Fictibacillus enclensis]|uniref:Spermidine/putrescine import ATP-binding protein PotA n=1 Tax=Fictibacillus enclensis TaxID=1017270 RepID=A0A0V8J4Z5_9BACL|nr:ABC transporter ATP-binding protein [Fictibacillus enclensis]KSU81928.1 spermidine/putrescine ABC transporter ATP-binding protein [Fictibacillus enclensis]SCC28028.1 iron(III) transport system ATP-binding protein [Fictibacillus enclensis]
MSSVTLKNITKSFKTVQAVKELSLDIQKGEFFTFLGPSGCGKTTTLRMIAGFYYPTTGSIFFGDREMTKVAPEKRNTGMVFQNYALFPHMTVYENVAFGLKVRKLASAEVKKRVEEALAKVRLNAFIKRQVSQLSGGQQQRVALARSLVIQPEILLLDEPLSNLDARLRDEMRTEILRLQRDYGITTIYVTHDQIEALSMSDRIAVFNAGECQQIGTPKEIYNEPANDFVASFIGETNLIPIQMEGREGEILQFSWEDDNNKRLMAEMPAAFSEEELLSVSIRPEAVEVYGEPPVNLQNVYEGTIELAQFTGASLNLFISLGGKVVQAMVLNTMAQPEPEPGDRVWVRLPESRVRVVPRVLEPKEGRRIS